MPTKKNPKHPLLEEIDSLLDKSGKSFNSAVREYHGWCVENNKCDDDSESEAKRLEEKFKKYRSRINGSPKAKPLRELSEFLQFLKGEVLIQSQPLLDLVNDDPICEEMKKLSPKIREQIIVEEENSEP